MISTYLRPLAEIDLVRDEHLAWLDGVEQRGVLVTAGRQDPPVGGIVLLDVASEAEAVAVMADDPYLLRGLATYAATGWLPSRGRLAPRAG